MPVIAISAPTGFTRTALPPRLTVISQSLAASMGRTLNFDASLLPQVASSSAGRMMLSSAIYASFFFTVALLVTTAYFLMGGLPLLTLKHDTPLDARFVRGFFNVYYRAAFWTSLGAFVSYMLWGRYPFAIGVAVNACVVALLRKHLLQAMQQLGAQIEASGSSAIRHFRRVHSAALSVNLVQLVAIVWGLLWLSQQLR